MQSNVFDQSRTCLCRSSLAWLCVYLALRAELGSDRFAHALCQHIRAVSGRHVPGFAKRMISILQHWKTLSLKFSAIYLGYLGEKPLDVLQENLADVSTAETMLLIDPVMGDHGKLYRGFDQEYVEKMRCLISKG